MIYSKQIIYNDEKHITKDKVDLEIKLQNYVSSKYSFCPKIIDVVYSNDHCTIHMENLEEMCIADKYGDDITHVPIEIISQIRNIIKILFDDGIEYIDITPYNFIEKANVVYIIDFGHAYEKKKNHHTNWFLEEFLQGVNKWNPDFA